MFMQRLPLSDNSPADEPVLQPRFSSTKAASVRWCVVMVIAVVALYSPSGLLDGNLRLDSLDYPVLHRHRVQYAMDGITSGGGLPGWFTREQLGTPFWSNLQNFPFVPTRLALLPLGAADLYTGAIFLSAVLAALFTFLYARSLGAGPFAAAVGGWTFAAAGFFASRLLAGHLHLLEAYPSLPMLLWLIERCVAKLRAYAGSNLAWRQLLPLGLAAGCVALCGHPQLPMYALAIAGLYALWRLRGWQRIRTVAVLTAGAGCAAFALVPMSMLVTRSTRVIGDLAHSPNDLALPVSRLAGAFLAPWIDGWPESVARIPHRPFTGYANDAYFWDTFNYVGWTPWVAAVALAGWCVARRNVPRGAVLFLVLMGVVCLSMALPWLQALARQMPGTLVRAPCRLTYPVTLALSLALAGAVQLAIAHLRRSQAIGLLIVPLAWHAIDLTTTSRQFVHRETPAVALDGRDDAWLTAVGDGRVAFDTWLISTSNRRYDDIGFYDSIQMARYYEMITALGQQRRSVYLETLNGDSLPARAMRACAVRITVGFVPRPNGRLIGSYDRLLVHQFDDAASRVSFVPAQAISFLDDRSTLDRLRDRNFDLASGMILPETAAAGLVRSSVGTQASGGATVEAIRYSRPTPDVFEMNLVTGQPGAVRIIETFDPGWTATLNGEAASILPANHGMMAVPIAAPGQHQLRLRYRTPGRLAGLLLSCISVGTLAVLCVLPIRPARSSPSTSPSPARR